MSTIVHDLTHPVNPQCASCENFDPTIHYYGKLCDAHHDPRFSNACPDYRCVWYIRFYRWLRRVIGGRG